MLKQTGYDSSYAQYCDHTVLRAYTTTEKVEEFCAEAKRLGTYSVCVNPIHVELVHAQLAGTQVKTCCVIGFPLGANKPEVKAFEAAQAVKDGADEVDMVLNVGALRDGNTDLVLRDIRGVVEAAAPALVKVIIETCYLTDEQKVVACELSCRAGAAFVKTSTGMATGGATVHDVALMKQAVAGRAKVKASGGIENRRVAYEMIQAGAERLGVSRVPQIVADDTTILSATITNQPPKVS